MSTPTQSGHAKPRTMDSHTYSINTATVRRLNENTANSSIKAHQAMTFPQLSYPCQYSCPETCGPCSTG